MNQTNYLSQTIEYIESHIKDKITIEDIAEHICLSKYHLHRITTTTIGRPLMDYVRARKLADSLDQLIYSDKRLIDICYEYGFNYEQSYINAFKKEFGITPNTYRKGDKPIKVTQKFDLSTFPYSQKELIIMPFFISKKSMTLVGLKNYFDPIVNQEEFIATKRGTDFFYNHSHKISHAINPCIYIGYSVRKKHDPNYNMYMPSLEVNKTTDIPEGMSVLTINPHQYAVFRYIGNMHADHITAQRLKKIKKRIDEWLTTSEYKRINEFDFEYIDSSLTTENYCEMDIYIPVKSIPDTLS